MVAGSVANAAVHARSRIPSARKALQFVWLDDIDDALAAALEPAAEPPKDAAPPRNAVA